MHVGTAMTQTLLHTFSHHLVRVYVSVAQKYKYAQSPAKCFHKKYCKNWVLDPENKTHTQAQMHTCMKAHILARMGTQFLLLKRHPWRKDIGLNDTVRDMETTDYRMDSAWIYRVTGPGNSAITTAPKLLICSIYESI